jgi:DNA-binding YbaB/EbfC family protein
MSKGFDLGGLLQQAKQLQERLTSVQEEIAARTAEGRAGGGMVTAVVNGRMELLRVEIDPSLLEKTPDRTMLQDLVVAAVNEALRAARALVADEMQKVTGGLPIPGLG